MGDLVSPSRVVGGSEIVNWLTTVIHQIWDSVKVSVGDFS